jgi:hypothetical protein
MKSLFKTILIVLVGFTASCATSKVNEYTKYQRQIDQKQDKLNEDAKDFIAVAKELIKKKSQIDPELQKAVDILEKGQTLLGSKIDDGNEYKNLTAAELSKAIDDKFKEDKKEANLIEELEDKNKDLVSDIITENIKTETIKDYERKKTIKWFAIFGTILSALGALFYFFPTRFLSIGARIFGFFVK